MRFIIDLWMDGYETEEELEAACIEYIKGQLDSAGTSVTVVKRIHEDTKG